MTHHRHKKLASLYLNQGILCLILLGIIVFLIVHTSLLANLFPTSVKDFQDLAHKVSLAEQSEFKIHCDTLYYTGYDNYNQKKVTGHYYYAIQDNYCVFFLLNAASDTPKETISDYQGIYHMIENPELYNQLTSNLAKDLDWSSSSLREMSIPVIASQPDHHTIPYIFLSFALLICTVTFAYFIVTNFLHYRNIKHSKH